MPSSEQINMDDAAAAKFIAALADEKTQLQAGQAISAALNSAELKQNAYEDVKELAKTIREIRAGMMKVSGDFIGFDSANFVDINGQPIKLGPKWAPHIKVCVASCIKSLTIADRSHAQLFDETLQYSLEQATQSVVMMQSPLSFPGTLGRR